MDIPAHRAAAVEPTPAHSFALRDDALVNITEEEERAAAKSVVPAPAPVIKGRKPVSEPVTAAPLAD